MANVRYAMWLGGANRNCGGVTGDFLIDKRYCLLYIRHMKVPDFEWDDSKNLDNIAKHGVSFQDAQQYPRMSGALFLKIRVTAIMNNGIFALAKSAARS